MPSMVSDSSDERITKFLESEDETDDDMPELYEDESSCSPAIDIEQLRDFQGFDYSINNKKSSLSKSVSNIVTKQTTIPKVRKQTQNTNFCCTNKVVCSSAQSHTTQNISQNTNCQTPVQSIHPRNESYIPSTITQKAINRIKNDTDIFINTILAEIDGKKRPSATSCMKKVTKLFNNIANEFDMPKIESKHINVIEDNNLLFEVSKTGLGKSYISGASHYPPLLATNATIGAYDDSTNICTNVQIEDNNVVTHKRFNYDEIKDVHTDNYDIEPDILISNALNEVKSVNGQNVCVIKSVGDLEFVDNELDHVVTNDNEIIIENKNTRWHVGAYLLTQHNKVERVEFFADPGANAGCIRTDYAIEKFGKFIRKNTRNSVLYTPGGPVIPKYVLWLTFPTKSGKILKSRMYLVDQLPVEILADINMLRDFGYSFKNETAPIFRHDAQDDIDFELKDQDEIFKIRDKSSFDWYKQFQIKKDNYLKYASTAVTINETPLMHDALYANGKPIYLHNVGSLIAETDTKQPNTHTTQLTQDEIDQLHSQLANQEIQLQHLLSEIDQNEQEIIFNDAKLYTYEYTDHMNDKHLIKRQLNILHKPKLQFINEQLGLINSDEKRKPLLDPKIDRFGNDVSNCKIYHRCLIIVAKQAFLASDAEIAEAKSKHVNEKLPFNNYDYLKAYPILFGDIYKNTYERVCAAVKRYKHRVFATHQFSRRTMKVPPARLGIKPEHRDKTMYAPQYPINARKRLDMINYTLENIANGFWKPVKYSLHCVPYTMVPKKRHGVIYRYRPAFDGRVVNQYCELMNSNMPTIKDFDDLHSIRGTTTCADVKNCFDCIPLHPDDWQYARAMTPIGICQMTCLTYGWMNAAPNAQRIMNNLSLFVGNTLAYIDDISIKHPFEEGADGIVNAILRLFHYCDVHNILLHPTKFFPACTESEGFAFIRTLQGSKVGQPYLDKILILPQPRTRKELDNFKGVVGYIGRFIYHKAHCMYWLNDMESRLDPKDKILKWTPEANLAYQQLVHLIKNSPLLYNPTRDGEFCVKTDACNYGIGAVLYQKQKHPETGEERWVIVDMWSKVIPKQLRHCHSMIHEAYAVVHALEHWQFYLMKRKFTLATDNNPVANIFTHKYRDINPITQRQLLRLRNKVTMFTFTSNHVSGLKNELADSLSRFTTELIERDKTLRVFRPIDSIDTNNNPLTKEEKKAFDIYLQKAKELKQKKQALSMDKSFHTVNQLLCLGDESIATRYQRHKDIRNADWNNLLHNYRLNANIFEKRNIAYLLDDAENECIVSDESEFNDKPFNAFKDDIKNILQILEKLPQPTLNTLNNTLHENTQQTHQLFVNNILQDIENHHKINAADEVYNPTQDERDISPANKPAPLSANRVQTRSKTKHNDSDSDDDDDDDDFQYAQFSELQFKSKTREDLMQHLFGHRRELNIFNSKRFLEHQLNDNVLKVAKRVFKNKTFNDQNNEDVQLVNKWCPELILKMVTESFRITKDGLIQVNQWVGKRVQRNIWVDYVPFNIRGKLMDYAHHNPQCHHFGYNDTYNWLEKRYWWDFMHKDVKSFCDTCLPCQFSKGSARHRAPLKLRELSIPRKHIFCDFLGSIYGKYYILVIVDYATGYTMLIPTIGNDALVVVDALVNKWRTIFGWFDTLETDWGSGFNNKIIEAIARITGIKTEIAEPRNHRSIGKVERIIGFIQQILNTYNQLLDEQLTNNVDQFDHNWQIIEILLPFIQTAINQRRPRFTGQSPNMLTLGTNVKDATDLGDIQSKLKQTFDKMDLNVRDHDYVEKLFKHIIDLNRIFQQDWRDYTYVSKMAYDTKYKITRKKISNYKRKFKVGNQVLYYIGDKATTQGKWRRKWTGPWTVNKQLNDSTLIIGDPTTGNEKRVSFDRIKVFKRDDIAKYSDYFDDDDIYVAYKNSQKEILYNYRVAVRGKDINLDYTSRAKTNFKS